MNGTGDRRLDNLMIAVTQQAVDDYKHILAHYARLKDSATVQVYKIERRLRGKMTSIEDFFNRGDFCVLEEGTADRVCSEIKKRLNFQDERIILESEYLAAKARLQTDEPDHPLFYTADEAAQREDRITKNTRENTIRGIVKFLNKVYPNDKKAAAIIEEIESKLINKTYRICEKCKGRFESSEMVNRRFGYKRKWYCEKCNNILKGE